MTVSDVGLKFSLELGLGFRLGLVQAGVGAGWYFHGLAHSFPHVKTEPGSVRFMLSLGELNIAREGVNHHNPSLAIPGLR